MNRYLILLVLLLTLPTIYAMPIIDININKLFLADEDIAFFIRLQNPTNEIIEARLFVELISEDRNFELAEEGLMIYPGDFMLRTFNEKLNPGNYKLRVELKDKFFDTVLDQRILEFNVAESCTELICSLEGAYKKCDCGRNEIGLGTILSILFSVILIGIFFLFYFEIKRRRALG